MCKTVLGAVAVDAGRGRFAVSATARAIITATRVATDRRRMGVKSSFSIEAIATIEVMIKVVQSRGAFRWVACPKVGMAGVSVHQKGQGRMRVSVALRVSAGNHLLCSKHRLR